MPTALALWPSSHRPATAMGAQNDATRDLRQSFSGNPRLERRGPLMQHGRMPQRFAAIPSTVSLDINRRGEGGSAGELFFPCRGDFTRIWKSLS